MSRAAEHDRHGDRAAARSRKGRSAPRTWAPASTPGIPATSTTTPCSRTSRRSGPRRRATAPRPRDTDRRRRSAPNMRRPQALYVSPWLGGTWRLRDAVEYMTDRVDWRRSTTPPSTRTRCSSIATSPAGIRSRKGRAEAPYAYVVPQDQRDPVAAVEMLRRLAFSGVRVSQLTAPVTIDGDRVPGRHLGGADRSGVRARSRAKCSTSRSIRRFASRPAARSTRRTTRPAGRCRCRWVCERSLPPRR